MLQKNITYLDNKAFTTHSGQDAPLRFLSRHIERRPRTAVNIASLAICVSLAHQEKVLLRRYTRLAEVAGSGRREGRKIFTHAMRPFVQDPPCADTLTTVARTISEIVANNTPPCSRL